MGNRLTNTQRKIVGALAIVAVVSIVAVICVRLLFRLQNGNPVPSPSSQTNVLNEQWVTYTSKNLGISFDYPTSWGPVSEDIQSPADVSPDNGTRLDISFSHFSDEADGEYLKLFSALPGYQPYESAPETFLQPYYYGGGQDVTKACPHPDQVQKRYEPGFCRLTKVAGENAIEDVILSYFPEASGSGFQYSAAFNLKDRRFPGLRVEAGLPELDGDSRIQGLCEECGGSDTERFVKAVPQILEEVTADKGQAADAVRGRLAVIRRLVSSIRFTK